MNYQWQPIETAPKDGTAVLIYQPKEKIGSLVLEDVIYVCYYNDEGKWEEADGEMYSTFNPTHWMPLPETPKEYEGENL